MSIEIVLQGAADGFAENKVEARDIRLSRILPALARREAVVLDFRAVRYATQSFVHVLVGEALQQYGERVLEMIEFRHCTPQVKSVIELVVDYSLGGFAERRGA
ncbi:MAG TPA: STAS-like domain-containing protein [Thermoanaerobaculia bacterium]